MAAATSDAAFVAQCMWLLCIFWLAAGTAACASWCRRRRRHDCRVYETWRHPTSSVRIVDGRPFDWATLPELAVEGSA